MVKYRINNKIVNGSEIVKIANREFTKNSQGRGRYGRPHTSDGAYYFLTSGSNRGKFDIDWWSSKMKKWMYGGR